MIYRKLATIILGVLPVPIVAFLNLGATDLWIKGALTYAAFVVLPGLVTVSWLRTRAGISSSIVDTTVYSNVLGLSILAGIAWTLARLQLLTLQNIVIVQEILLGLIVTIHLLFPKVEQFPVRNLREVLSDTGFVAIVVALSALFLLPELVLQANGLLIGGDDAIISRVGEVAFATRAWPNLSQALHPFTSPADIAPGGPLVFGTFGAAIDTNPVFLSSVFAIFSASLATLALCLLTKRFNDKPLVKYGVPVVWLLGYAGAPFLFNLTLTFAFNGGTPEGLMSIPSFLLVIITLTDIIRSESPSRTQLLLLAVFLTNVMLLSQLTFLMIAILLLSFGAVILKVRGPKYFVEGCATIGALSLALFPPYLELSKALSNSPMGNVPSAVLKQLYYPYATDAISITTAIGSVGMCLLIFGFLMVILGIGKPLAALEKTKLRLLLASLGVTILCYGVLSFTIIGGSLLGIGAVRFVEYIPLVMIPIMSEGLRRLRELTNSLRFGALLPIFLLALIATTAFIGASHNIQMVSFGVAQPSIFNYWQLSAAQWLAARGTDGVVVADMNNGSSNAVFLLNFAQHPVVYRDKSELYLDIYGTAPPYNIPYYYANLVLNNPNSTNAYNAYNSVNFTYYFLEIPYNNKQIEAFSPLPYMELVFNNPGVKIFQYTGFMRDATFFLQATNFVSATKGVQAQYLGYGALNSSVSFPNFPNAVSSISPSGPSFDGNSTSYTLNIQQSGNFSVYIHRDVNHTSEYLVISVNGGIQGAVFFESLGWSVGSPLKIFLPKGQDTLTITFEGTVAWASPVDYLVVAPALA